MILDPTLGRRAAEGAALATAIAIAAWRAGSLDRSGAVAAVAVGTVAVAAGWTWGALLVAYFVASSALSKLGADAKAARTGGVVEKGGARDAGQVFANGGPFAAAALLSLTTDAPWIWAAVGAGALAASAADTWGTEIGTWIGGVPRSIVGWRPVPAGTSGGVTAAGSLASLAGALFVAVLAALLGWPVAAAAAAGLGGVTGAFTDSLLGATVQQRRWCERCNVGTERAEHGCGAATVHRGGLGWLENDRVNLLASVAGAAVAGVVARWMAGPSRA